MSLDTTLPFVQDWKWKQRSLQDHCFLYKLESPVPSNELLEGHFPGASINGKLKISLMSLVIPKCFLLSKWIFGYPSSSLALLLMDLALAPFQQPACKNNSLEYTTPSFTWNTKIMLPPKKNPFPGVPIFRWTMLNFGELTCLSR